MMGIIYSRVGFAKSQIDPILSENIIMTLARYSYLIIDALCDIQGGPKK